MLNHGQLSAMTHDALAGGNLWSPAPQPNDDDEFRACDDQLVICLSVHPPQPPQKFPTIS